MHNDRQMWLNRAMALAIRGAEALRLIRTRERAWNGEKFSVLARLNRLGPLTAADRLEFIRETYSALFHVAVITIGRDATWSVVQEQYASELEHQEWLAAGKPK